LADLASHRTLFVLALIAGIGVLTELEAPAWLPGPIADRSDGLG
jgi:hypothetical protein